MCCLASHESFVFGRWAPSVWHLWLAGLKQTLHVPHSLGDGGEGGEGGIGGEGDGGEGGAGGLGGDGFGDGFNILPAVVLVGWELMSH